jgi:hypothetical protein
MADARVRIAMRFDIDGDGTISAEEREVAREIIRARRNQR